MKLSVFLLLAVCFLSCSKEEKLIDGGPVYVPKYDVNLYFVDSEGNDASDRLPLQVVEPDSCGVTFYELPDSAFAWTCFIDGVEVPDSCLSGGYDPDTGKLAYSKTMMRLEISKGDEDALRKFTLKVWTDYIYWGDYMHPDLHVFDYRFRCPQLFGDEVNCLQIIARATFFHLGRFDKTMFNAAPIEHRFSDFFIVADAEE